MKQPKLPEVVKYFREQKSTPELARSFFERYQANGWTVTRKPSAATHWRPERKPMKDWKRTALGFIERQKRNEQNRQYRQRI
ncbi:hypothetical protein IC229_27595 [Spirosoma sp. BT702]|uniref:Uncharacterized protein n=1 Tax=Spirosoma profusum TaxID=2771354 RepID=A0A926Y5F2_9BACT|nr:hypothetical protein [Spirosoma profusum]MBD2704436.1 hypothetical protein [Spirosoma profusum]